MLTDRDHEAKQSSTHTVPDKLQGRQLTHLYVVIGDPSPFVDAQKSLKWSQYGYGAWCDQKDARVV